MNWRKLGLILLGFGGVVIAIALVLSSINKSIQQDQTDQALPDPSSTPTEFTDTSADVRPSETPTRVSTSTATPSATASPTSTPTNTPTVVFVPNTNPTANITTPVAAGGTYNATALETISFAGTAWDAEDGTLTAGLVWISNIDGPIGTGGSFSAVLSPGTHNVTARITDSGGKFGATSITIVVPNTDPNIDITGPVGTGGTYLASAVESISFTATASDAEEGDLSANITWTSTLDGSIGAGASFSAIVSPGAHTVTAQISDSHSGTATANISVVVPNTDPVLHITSPATDIKTYNASAGESISFAASALDAEEGDISGSITWTSSIDGPIGSGGNFSAVLSVGTHTVSASVIDSDGGADSAWITAVVPNVGNTAPDVAIASPTHGLTVGIGTSINFTGTALDNEDGDLSASLVWTSSLVIGPIGTGAGFSTSSLGAGTHIITASVTDSESTTSTDTIIITITNDPPVVSITSPPDAQTYAIGSNITFSATAADTEDGGLSASLVWTSSLVVGPIGTGAGFSTSSLGAGTHTITASVTDSDTNPGSDSITLTITNDSPVVDITKPQNGAGFTAGESVLFEATAIDTESGDLSASLSWVSSRDGSIGTGASFSSSSLSVGAHTITASVVDTHANPGSDSVGITISNLSPSDDGLDNDLGGLWSNSGNALGSSNGTCATIASGDAPGIVHYWSWTGLNIPSNATVNSLSVTIEAKSTGAGDNLDVQVAPNFSDLSISEATSIPVDATESCTGLSSLSVTSTWGGSWTPANINDGVFLALYAVGEGNNVYADSSSITINYSVP